jgi:hypothetical protein
MSRSSRSWRFDGGLEVVGAALGERERRVGHPAQRHPLLRAGLRDRPLEVLARGLGVVALGRPGPEDRLRGGLVLGLAGELVVRPALERLHRRKGAALLDLDLALLRGHGRESIPR